MLDLRDCERGGGQVCGRLLVLPHRAEPSCALPSNLPVTGAGEDGDECWRGGGGSWTGRRRVRAHGGALAPGASKGFSSGWPGELTATSPSYEAIIVWWMDVIIAILPIVGAWPAAVRCPCVATFRAGLTRS